MQTQVVHLRIQQLEQQKSRLELDIQRFSDQLKAQIDPDVDEADPGLTTQTVTMALLRNARRKFDAITRALRQAKSGSYGICEDCGQSINPERLEVFPQATQCVPCKSRQEQFGRRAA